MQVFNCRKEMQWTGERFSLRVVSMLDRARTLNVTFIPPLKGAPPENSEALDL